MNPVPGLPSASDFTTFANGISIFLNSLWKPSFVAKFRSCGLVSESGWKGWRIRVNLFDDLLETLAINDSLIKLSVGRLEFLVQFLVPFARAFTLEPNGLAVLGGLAAASLFLWGFLAKSFIASLLFVTILKISPASFIKFYTLSQEMKLILVIMIVSLEALVSSTGFLAREEPGDLESMSDFTWFEEVNYIELGAIEGMSEKSTPTFEAMKLKASADALRFYDVRQLELLPPSISEPEPVLVMPLL